jgi:O-antigen ligase
MIAVFLVILWLFPFDLAQIGQSLPIDLKLDRLVLPLIVLLWVLALAVGGRAAPRVRVTAIHVGVFIFAAFAFLSVVISARYLNQTLGLALGVKRLALLVSYVIFFVLIASVVRRSEIRAFLRYTLGLAVLAAVGTIIEYRFDYNVFNQLAHTFLPGFHISTAAAGIDLATGGRRIVSGPADHPLEAVGMFAMALPIALVGILEARRWRPRLLYGLAGALLIAAVMSTERKSGLLALVAVILTLGFFRRRQLLPLAPLGVIMVVVVKFLTPGAIGSVTSQLAPSQLATGTVDDRVIRYDAIRPDMWAHLIFGQGFGTYTVRVLDNELLSRLVEGGVVGLSAYVLMLLTIVLVAAGLIRRRVPVAASVGLVAACAAASALVLSALYDFMAFPHGPYILLSLAGLLAAAMKSPQATSVRTEKRAPPIREPAWSY